VPDHHGLTVDMKELAGEGREDERDLLVGVAPTVDDEASDVCR
jgi:hypothetical protein